MLLSNLLSQENGTEVFLEELKQYIPDSHIEDHRSLVRDRSSDFHRLPYRLVKTHDRFLQPYEKVPFVYIVRDGRDVLTSYYHYLSARQDRPLELRCDMKI